MSVISLTFYSSSESDWYRITGDFNLIDLFTKTTIHGNLRHNLVDSILSNTASPIGDIEKA